MKTRNIKNKPWNVPRLTFLFFLVFIMVLFLKLTYLSLFQVIDGINIQKFASNRNTVKTILKAKRGTIYDKDGNSLAQNVSTYTVIAYLSPNRTNDPKNPQHVVEKEKTAEKLAEVLGADKNYFLELFNRDAYQVELGVYGRGITELVKDKIVALDLAGIDFIETVSRNYPNGNFASYIIGYAQKYDEIVEINDIKYNQYKLVGELGIEAKYDDLLAGVDGYLEYQQGGNGYKIPDTKEKIIKATDGSNIYLTIDSAIQRFVESAIKEQIDVYNPEWMVITVMDAKTGEILASGSSPSFDPNIKDMVSYENPLVSYTYEPGSTMKIFTYMCAIEKGTYNGKETFKSGSYQIGEDTVYDWDTDGFGVIDYDTGFMYSSNVGIAHMLQKYITRNDLKDCFDKYGFGKTTGIELSREQPGKIKFTYPIEVAAAGYGQGITTTPIQNLQALSIIANNGHMITPRIIEKIVDPNTGKIIYEPGLDMSEQIVKESTTDKIKDLMWHVVNDTSNKATGVLYGVPGLDLIGKTSTAQIYENGQYLSGSQGSIYGFAGMFPKDDPEIIIYSATKKPRFGTSNATILATKSVVQSIAKYKNMLGESIEETENKYFDLESYINKNTNKIKEELTKFGADVIVLGNGEKIVSQYPNKNEKIVAGDKVFLVTNNKETYMPYIYGWSRSNIQTLTKLLGIKVEFEGYGYATNYNIKKDTLITPDMVLKVTLTDKYNLDSKKE